MGTGLCDIEGFPLQSSCRIQTGPQTKSETAHSHSSYRDIDSVLEGPDVQSLLNRN
jgi:hypothetical protein